MDDAEQLLPALPALRARRRRLGRPAAQRVAARSCRSRATSRRSARARRKRVLGLLEDLAENRKDDYATFWAEFGQVLKEGIGEDHANRERIAKLLRFASTATEGGADRVARRLRRARDESSRTGRRHLLRDRRHAAAARSSPHLEVFRKKGVEVLLLTDRVDEWMLVVPARVRRQAAGVGRARAISTSASSRTRRRTRTAEGRRRVQGPGRAREGRARRARQGGPRDAAAHRFAGLPGLRRARDQRAPGAAAEGRRARRRRTSQPILEINPQHPLVQRLKDDDAKLADWSHLLFDQALLAEGGRSTIPPASCGGSTRCCRTS